jgi:hypothetical protein
METEKTSHPSFGTISVSRGTSSGKMNLFNASIQQNHFILIEIQRAALYRNVYHDSVLPEGIPIVRLYMSPSQFADLITSPNTGGTPCTLVNVNGVRMPEPEYVNKRVQLDDDFKKKMDEVASISNEFYTKIQEILMKPSIGKNDRKEIIKLLDMMNAQITSHVPFIKKTFTEQMDKTATEAKFEVTQFIEEKLKRLGLEKFKDQLLLDSKENNEDDI